MDFPPVGFVPIEAYIKAGGWEPPVTRHIIEPDPNPLAWVTREAYHIDDTTTGTGIITSVKNLRVSQASRVAIEYRIHAVDNIHASYEPELTFETAVADVNGAVWQTAHGGSLTILTAGLKGIIILADTNSSPPLGVLRWRLENPSSSQVQYVDFSMLVTIMSPNPAGGR